jgi:hypothetical protein
MPSLHSTNLTIARRHPPLHGKFHSEKNGRGDMNKTIKSITFAGVMGVLAFGSTASFAFSVDCPDGGAGPLNGCVIPGSGVTPGSYPMFDQVVAVTAKQDNGGKVTVQAKQYKGSLASVFSLDGLTSASLEKPKFKLNATIDGGILSGDVKISGKINGEKVDMKADLAGAFDASPDYTLWGFNTANIQCNDALNAFIGGGGCTSSEVVYLNLLEPVNPTLGPGKISTAGRAITSVPVPAAAWLFGSGLMGLLAVSRRRRQQA